MAVTPPARTGSPVLAEIASATSITVNVPAGAAAGEILVALIVTSAGTAAVPSGWTRAGSNVGTAVSVFVDYRVVSSEPASYTWSGFTLGRATGFMQRIAGADLTTPIDVAATVGTNTGVGSTCVVAAQTTVTANALLLSVVGGNAAVGVTWTQPPGFTLVSQSTGTGRGGAFAADAVQVAAGSTGTQTWSWSTSALEMRAVMVAIRGASGQQFLANTFGSARALVEVAFGADITAAAGTWAWTDVTADAMHAAQVRITQGRTDETSTAQAASCSFTLLNSTGKYTPFSPGSSLYPNVKKGTPVRVSVDVGSGFKVAFFGFAAGFTPAWDTSAKLATVQVSAGGLLRRLSQGVGVLRTELAYSLLAASPAPVLYLPMEDSATALSGNLASGLPGGGRTQVRVDDYLGLVSAVPQWASGDLGSVALPTSVADLGNGSHALLPKLPTVSASGWAVDHVVSVSSDNRGRNLDFWPVSYINGTAFPRTDFDIEIQPRGLTTSDQVFLNIFVVQADGSSSSSVLATINTNIFDGGVHHFRLAVAQSGGNINWTIYVDGVATSGSTVGTLQAAAGVEFNPFFFATNGKFAVGHLALWNTSTPPVSAATAYSAASGYVGETADARLVRLCARQSVPLTVSGTSNIAMGAEPVAPFATLIRECETADGGLLLDGFDAGLVYVTRSSRYNLAADLTIDASAGHLAPPFAPVDDDQRIRNDVTVSRSGGLSAQFSDTNGPLGVNKVGDYDTSISVNTSTDGVLAAIASWNVHLGTVEGLRYPNLNLDFVAATTLANSFLVAGYPGQIRFDVTNLTSRATQAPPDAIQLTVEGWTITFDVVSMDATVNCSPFGPWRVVSTQTGTYPWRIDSDTSTASVGVNTVANSLSVASTGRIWTTTATFPADFPFDIDLEGEQCTVTAITGTSSPQTFTLTRSVNGVVKSHLSGAVVKLWQPASIAL